MRGSAGLSVTAGKLMVAGAGEAEETIVAGMAMGNCLETLSGVQGAVLRWEGSIAGIRNLPTRRKNIHSKVTDVAKCEKWTRILQCVC